MINGKKCILKMVLSLLLFLPAYADKGEDVYNKVCSACHVGHIDRDKLMKNFLDTNNTLLKLKAPTISQISHSMKYRIGDPTADKDIHRMEVSAFIADYIIYPDKSKSVLNPNVGKHFETMPSLKGKLSTEEIEAISNFVYDYGDKINKKRSINYVEFEKAVERAKKEDKIIIIKATAPRCRFCIKMDKKVLTDEKVVDLLNKEFIIVSVDLSKQTLPLDLRASMTPSFFFIFVDKNNKDNVKIKRIPGAWSKEDFLEILKESILAKNKS